MARRFSIGALLFALPAPAFAQVTISFQDGVSPDPSYAGTRDFLVKEGTDEAWSPTTNYDNFGEGVSGDPDRAAMLIRFDLCPQARWSRRRT